VSLTGVLTWSFATEEAGAGVWAARVGAVLVMGGLLMVLGGIVMLLRGSRRQRAAR
jgi:predicted phage tail protein